MKAIITFTREIEVVYDEGVNIKSLASHIMREVERQTSEHHAAAYTWKLGKFKGHKIKKVKA